MQLMTIDEVAAICQVSKWTIRRLLERQRIPPPIRIGRAPRWRSSDIEKWLERGAK